MKQTLAPNVCQRCGGELNIALHVSVPATGEAAEDGEILIFDEDKPFIEDVLFYECAGCGAMNEETGLTLSQKAGVFYLRPLDTQEKSDQAGTESGRAE